ncbi:MAG: FAD-dependent monooxygenase [Pseudonocardiaceae bacterium]
MTRVVPYDEVTDPAQAESITPPLDQILLGVRGALDAGHPGACEALTQAAAAAGATVIRGVGDVDVEPGDAPVVHYEHDDVAHELRCRMVVGADGRMSTVRRRLGIELNQTTPRIMIGGMLARLYLGTTSRKRAGSPARIGRRSSWPLRVSVHPGSRDVPRRPPDSRVHFIRCTTAGPSSPTRPGPY